uniref:Hyaluronidase n=1 Tax=Scleropages formosus TaxID=113540 RepID=A0A8C9V003_SCLFO
DQNWVLFIRGSFYSVILSLSFLEVLSSTLPPAAAPLIDGQPFIVAWNIPTSVCRRLDVALDMLPFQLVSTPAKVTGQDLTLFYNDRLGLYPHVMEGTKQQVHGGIPQRGNLGASLAKAQGDIRHYIPSVVSPGLAVIDWEDWRPLWDRNWGSKNIYRSLSISHALQQNPFLSPERAVPVAKWQFQVAARRYMLSTLSLGTRLRPQQRWGYYLFPNCYNYGWEEAGYTGRCPQQVMRQNDELLWLWEGSTALYPSVYLAAPLGDRHAAALFVRNRVQEAMRIAALPRRAFTLPVYVYTRPVFADQNRRFLSEGDLVSTIGESAAVGASGSVLWGASASCEALSSYLTSILNPYVANVTAAARLCSDMLCQGNGRCLRKNYDSEGYLHLNPDSFVIFRSEEGYLVVGWPTFSDLTTLADRFTCQCYAGRSCSPQLPSQIPRSPIVILQMDNLAGMPAHCLPGLSDRPALGGE